MGNQSLVAFGQSKPNIVLEVTTMQNQFGSGKEINSQHSEVRVYHLKKDGSNGRLKRIEPTYPTSGRAKPKKFHHK